jgi:YegS/Rv2252/BmrU family lipid kinase
VTAGRGRRSVCLIVNPSAGGGRAARLLPRVEGALRGHDVAFRVERTGSLLHACDLAREAARRGEVAAAMGGDGLLGAVAGELRGTKGVLGVVPGGRGNDFARKLGIGADPRDACTVLACGREMAVDVADVGGRPFLGIASAGLDSDVQAIANATRLPLGRLVYLYATLRALRTWEPAGWEVEVDGERHAFRGYSVAVANSGVFGGGMYLVPDAALDDGLLDVVLTRDKPRVRFLVNLPKVFRGTHVRDKALVFLRGRQVAFQADRPFVAYADGDPIAPLPATVRVSHRSLRVLVP